MIREDMLAETEIALKIVYGERRDERQFRLPSQKTSDTGGAREVNYTSSLTLISQFQQVRPT